MDKGNPIPVIFKRKVNESKPLEINLSDDRGNRKVVREEHISFDKIVENSDSDFYITGKTTKIGMGNFMQLIEKHDVSEVEGFREEDIIISSDLITKIATAEVIDEYQEDMKYIDAVAIGIFITALLLSIFALFSKTMSDIKTFSWILLLVSLVFLGNYTYRGVKSGELNRVIRICIKSLSKK